MNIQHTEKDTKGAFFVLEEGIKVAEMTYTKNSTYRIIIDHTEVLESQKGRGLGKALILFSVEYARKKHLKILPLCPFARRVFQRNKELHDVT